MLDDLGPRDLELEALAPQVLDEDRKVQLAASTHDEGVRAVGLLHAQCDVPFQFGEQALAQLSAGHVLSLAARER